MNKDQLFRLGNISKLHGYKGEVVAVLDVDDPTDYYSLKNVYIELKNQIIPFQIKEILVFNQPDKPIIRFLDIDTEQKAMELLNCDLYLPLDMLPELEGNKFYFHEVIDFKVIDQQFGNIGLIKSIIPTSNYGILQVFCNGKEILIPAVDEFIIEVNKKSRQMLINAPDGLIDMYLNS